MDDYNMICTECRDNLNTAYKFREQCLRNKNAFINYIANLQIYANRVNPAVNHSGNFSATEINNRVNFPTTETNCYVNFSGANMNNRANFSGADFNNHGIDRNNRTHFSSVGINNSANFSGTFTNNQLNPSDMERDNRLSFPSGAAEETKTWSNQNCESNVRCESEFINLNDFNQFGPRYIKEERTSDMEGDCDDSLENVEESVFNSRDDRSQVEAGEFVPEPGEVTNFNKLIKCEIPADEFIMERDPNTENAIPPKFSCRVVFRDSPKKERKKYVRKGPFPCEVCKKFSRDLNDLNRHMRIHTGEKPFECDVCKKTFTWSHALITHKRIHTGEKPHQCKICGKCFYISGNLVKHLRTHTTEKLHKCKVCKNKFTVYANLVEHMKSHENDKPYSCEICNKKYTRHTCLVKHIQSHAYDSTDESDNDDESAHSTQSRESTQDGQFTQSNESTQDGQSTQLIETTQGGQSNEFTLDDQ